MATLEPSVSTDIDLITVDMVRTDDIAATHARLHVRIKGSALFTGSAALTKSREVAALVSQLSNVGVGPTDIELAGASIDVSSAGLVRMSEATYRVAVTCRTMELLPEVLGVIAAQKNIHLASIEWLYPDDGELQASWLDAAIVAANASARRIASSLGVTLIGVHRFASNVVDSEQSDNEASANQVILTDIMARRRTEPVDLGVDMNHSKSVTTHVTIRYHISGFGGDGIAPAPG